MRFFKMLAIAAVLCAATAPRAGALDELKAFVNQTHAAQTRFSQVVVARNGKTTQKSQGTFTFQRPGKFRFVYEQPYSQIIVGDGKKLWTYDPELNQVTVKPIGEALGSSPAALLTGDGQLERNFTLKDAGAANDLLWVEASPKQQDAGFERVRIGLKDGTPLKMEVLDNFGQTTHLQFTHFQRNAKTNPADFVFTPPEGADVVGE